MQRFFYLSVLLVINASCNMSTKVPDEKSNQPQAIQAEIEKIQQLNHEKKYALTKNDLDVLLTNKSITQAEYAQLLEISQK